MPNNVQLYKVKNPKLNTTIDDAMLFEHVCGVSPADSRRRLTLQLGALSLWSVGDGNLLPFLNESSALKGLASL